MAFPCSPATCGQAAGDMLSRRPLRAGLTATQATWILAHPKPRFDRGPEAVEPPYLRSRQCQAVGGIGLGAVSDDQDFEATWEPSGGGPIRIKPRQSIKSYLDLTLL
jgi:hypothetical protein